MLTYKCTVLRPLGKTRHIPTLYASKTDDISKYTILKHINGQYCNTETHVSAQIKIRIYQEIYKKADIER